MIYDNPIIAFASSPAEDMMVVHSPDTPTDVIQSIAFVLVK
jgi:hypothetical protein